METWVAAKRRASLGLEPLYRVRKSEFAMLALMSEQADHGLYSSDIKSISIGTSLDK